ncbi:MAG: ABC transporter ATP-binding protein [Alphaproteobacteria bacterium]|nr:ABC transporter ATP-binding protein [Alphaproteobacteria bacterium]
MTQTVAPEVSTDSASLLRWLLGSYIRPHAAKLVAATLCMALTAGAAAALAWLAQPALDDVIQAQDETMRYLVPLTVFAVVTVNGFAIYGQNVLMQMVGQRIVADLQIALFRHFIRADLAFLNNVHTGNLISRCIYDSDQIRIAVSGCLIRIARDVLMFVALTGVMLYRDWQLALMTFVVLPILGLGIGKIGRRARQASKTMLEHTADLTASLSEAFEGARLIKVYGTEEHETARAREVVERRRHWLMRLAHNRALSSPLSEILGGAAIAMAIFYGGWRAAQGDVSLGVMASFLAALVLCYRPLRRLAELNAVWQEGLAAAQRIRAALDIEPTIVDRPGAEPLRLAGGTVRFEDVHFSFDQRGPVIKGVTLEVPSGKMVALVGSSGAGKSTLLNLLCRLYDVDSGRITVDGTDVRDTTLASLRRAIAVVSQEVVLFDDTVRANIAYGRGDASAADIAAAARVAAASDFIAELPQGYDTVVGEHGVKLSAGQRQRIAIARAVLKDAPILLLDEATSSLDSESEQVVKLALARLMQGRTTLVVAHRLSTVIDADQIHVVADGRVVESGRHGELLARGGVYAQLYSMQAIEDSLEALEADEESAEPAVLGRAGT